jgi:stress-induced morphogen
MELLEVLKSEIQTAQLINKILQDELKRTGSEYNIAENLPTYEILKSQSETYPISENETPDKKSKNPKKPHGGKKQCELIIKSKQLANNQTNLTYKHLRTT